MRRTCDVIAVLVLVGAVAFSGCVTLKVNHDFDRQADFGSYETYSWQDSDVSVADNDPLMHQRLIRAVDSQLTQKGLRQVDTDPDLFVTYHGESEDIVVLDRVSYYDGWYRYGGIGVSTTRARSYEQGTLIVDLVDASENRLVWRGVATDTVASSPDAQSRQIETATRQMFRRYPPSQ
jgi:hypothetical protein